MKNHLMQQLTFSIVTCVENLQCCHSSIAIELWKKFFISVRTDCRIRTKCKTWILYKNLNCPKFNLFYFFFRFIFMNRIVFLFIKIAMTTTFPNYNCVISILHKMNKTKTDLLWLFFWYDNFNKQNCEKWQNLTQ